MFLYSCSAHSALLLCDSVCWPLAHVVLDGHSEDPRAVHGSMRTVRVLAVHQGCHRAASLDASGPQSHPAQSPGVDTHGTKHLYLLGK